MQTHHSHRLNCPDCQGLVRRVPRRLFDRLAGLFLPVRRYQCSADTCGWEGLLRLPHRSGSQRLGLSSYRPSRVLDAARSALSRPPAP